MHAVSFVEEKLVIHSFYWEKTIVFIRLILLFMKNKTQKAAIIASKSDSLAESGVRNQSLVSSLIHEEPIILVLVTIATKF